MADMQTTGRRSGSKLPDVVKNFIEQRIESAGFDLPMLPQVVTEVLSLCNSEDSDAAKISELVHQDQAIAGHVLRVVNSPMFGGQSRIVSLQQAISRLGLNQLVEIVVAVSVRSRLFTTGRQIDMLKQMWRHSVATGFLAKEIARIRRRNVESMFLCGLMHDVGKTVLLDALGQLESEMGRDLPRDDVYLALDVYHAQVGGMLARQWRMPEQVVEAVEHHHDYDSAEKFQEAAITVNFSDQMAHVMFPSPDRTVTRDDLEQAKVLEDLNLYRDDLESLFAKEEQLTEMLEAMVG